MKILIVDVNFDYKNPMYRQFYLSLLNCMEVDFFGPGYVSRQCLERGICKFIDENGKYDAVLMGTYFLYSTGHKSIENNAYRIHRSTIPYYDVNDAYQCCEKIYRELLSVKNLIKVFAFYEDIWAMSVEVQNICYKLLEIGFYILSWPLEYMDKEQAKSIRKHCYRTNCLYELAGKYGGQYIPISFHGIGYHEIFVGNFQSRKYDWCIPGNREEWFYPERNKAQEIIKNQQKRIWRDDPYQLLSVVTIQRKHMEWYKFRNKTEKILSWMWGKNDAIASQPQMQHIAACREQYLESLRATKFVYADGGISDALVRKYFEVGACGAVLVAKRVPGITEMGFIHRQNCFIVDRYEDVITIDEQYEENYLEQIAKAGQRLILEKHMFKHRADALLETLQAIKQGVYEGAYWEDGNYVLKRPNHKK